MKVLQITGTYSPSINGVAIAVEKLKQELEKLGNDVVILAPENQNRRSHEKGIIRFPSLSTSLSKNYPIPLLPNIKTIIRLLQEQKPDIVHVHHPFHIGYFAGLIAKYYKIPLVFTYHTRYDAYAKHYFKFLPDKLKTSFVQNNVDKFCKKIDLIISPSKQITEDLHKKIPYLNIVTIPSGLPEIPRINLSIKTMRKELNIPQDKKILLTVCRLSEEKNLQLLLKTVCLLNDNFLLLIVGDGNFEKQLKELAFKEKVNKKIRFVGLVAHEKLGKFYQTADIFIYPSITETQGLIFLEALSFGLPIVAVDCAASREWVPKDIGILTKNNPEDFARGILEIEKKDKKKMSEKAIDWTKQFSATKTTNRIFHEYKSVVKRYKLGNRLLETGWQSWSPRPKGLLKWPAWNYPPKPDEFLPHGNKILKKKKPAIGWCSWYAFGSHISENKILRQAEWFAKHKEIPIEYILIDGGWTKNGDWTKPDSQKFPHDLKLVNKQINKLGFKSGIWVAPFWVEPKSNLFHRHADWVIKNGLFYADGFKSFPFDRFFIPKYILDIRRPEVINYIFECLNYLLLDCGFKLLKLDYLYSLYFIPDISTREAGSILNNFFLEVKHRYPNVYTIACGSPLKPAVGAVDSMRIGPDIVSPNLENIPFLKNIVNTYKLNLVINNVKKRKWMIDYWNLDPDAFVCRPTLGLSDSKILALQKAIISAKGNLFLGDDMTFLTELRIKDFIMPLFKSL